MGICSSHCKRRNYRVRKITVTSDGVIQKYRTKPSAHDSLVCPLFGRCCGRLSAVDSTSKSYGETAGTAGSRWKRIFEARPRKGVDPVFAEDPTWAIRRHDFRMFINGNVFITSSYRGGLRKEDSSSSDESSNGPTPSNSTHSISSEDPIANANLETLRSFREKCCASDTKVEKETKDDQAILLSALVQSAEVVTASSVTVEEPAPNLFVPEEVIIGGRGESSFEDKADAVFEQDNGTGSEEPRAITEGCPLPLVDVKAGDIPVAESGPVLVSKDGDGPKDSSSEAAASSQSTASADPLSSTVIPTSQDVGQLPAAALSLQLSGKSKDHGKRLLSRRAMMSVDRAIPSEARVCPSTCASQHDGKLQNIPKPRADSNTKGTKSSHRNTSVDVSYGDKRASVSFQPGASSQKEPLSNHKVKNDVDSEVKVEHKDATKMPKSTVVAKIDCSSHLTTTECKTPSVPKFSSAEEGNNDPAIQRKRLKKLTKKKRKAKRRDSLVNAPVTSETGKHQVSGSTSPASRDTNAVSNSLRAHVSQATLNVPSAPDAVGDGCQDNSRLIDTGNKDGDSEEEIEYFYPDGSKIPKESVHHVISKASPSVSSQKNHSSQAQLMVKESEIPPVRKAVSSRVRRN